MNTFNPPYVLYNDEKAIASLDQNTVLVNPQTYDARHPYSKKNTFFLMSEGSRKNCAPRDKSVNYIYDSEQAYHPDHFSRFSYNTNCENNYCTGVWPGRYDVNGWCCSDIQPKGVSPPRFYNQPTRQCRVMSQARVDYNLMKNYGC